MENPERSRREGPAWLRPFILHYGCAVVSVALATWVRLLLDPLVGDHARYAVVLLAVLVTASYGGGLAGLTALALGALSTDYFLIPPRGEFGPKSAGGLTEMTLYSGLGLAIALICGFGRPSEEAVERLRQTKEELSQAEESLNLALRSSGIAVWKWDIANDVIVADEQSSVLFGLPPGEFPRVVAGFAPLVHPDDRERVQQALAASVEGGAEYNMRFRIVWRDGTVRFVMARAKVQLRDGRPWQLTGCTWDVTESQHAEERLRILNEQLGESVKELERRKERSKILNHMNGLLQSCSSSNEAYGIVAQFCPHLFPGFSGGLCIFSASRNVVNTVATWNDPCVSESEFDPDDCWGLRRGQDYIIDPGAIGTRCRHLKETEGGYACLPLMAQGTGLGILFLQKQSGTLPSEEFFTLEDRQLAGTFAESVAISLSNLYLQEALRRQSVRDPLTGLFNRRYLEESVDREFHRLARKEHPAGFAMLDLDHFKSINDTFGHEAGDALLRAFGQLLRERLRKEDIACRYGGEEFCILFAESSLEDTVRRAEEIRAAVSHITVQHGGQLLPIVTVSIGVASYPTNGTTLVEMISSSDSALYLAKKGGRDRVVAAVTSGVPEVSSHA